MKKYTLYSCLFLAYLSNAPQVSADCQTMNCTPSIDACCSVPCWQSPSNWYFEADFLYWSTDFNAISSINAGIATTDTTADATIHVKHPEKQWDPGVRLTAGWLGCDCWDVLVSWTNFYNSSTTSRSPFQLQILTDSLNATGRSEFVFRYNVADLELGKTLCLASCLSIRPLVGIHAISTQVNSQLNIIAPASTGTIETDGFAFDLNLKNEAWGIGPKIGVNTEWGNFKGLSLIANVNGALLYGQHQAKINAELDITSDIDISIHLVGSTYWQLISTVQLQSGLSYAGCLCNHEYRINALWECNSINQVNNILIFERSINMQGLTLGFEVAF